MELLIHYKLVAAFRSSGMFFVRGKLVGQVKEGLEIDHQITAECSPNRASCFNIWID